MSNDLLPQPCMQMGQFINVDTTPDLISNQEMRLLQPICSQISGRQDFHVMVPSAVRLGSVNMDTTLLPGKRKSPLQQSVQNKRMVLPMEHRPWASAPMPVQLTSVSPRTQYLPVSFVSRNSSVSCNKPGKQTAARKQTSQKPMLLKSQSESAGSVRFKMRESLAGALAMVQCHMEVPKESKSLDSETVANLLEGHVSEPVSALSGVDVMVSNGSTEILTLSDPSTLVGVSVQSVLPEILTITKTSDAQEIVAQEPEALKPFVQDNVSYSDNVFSKDDLLQGNDLSWALESDIDFTVNCQNDMIGAMANDGSQEKLLLDPQVLAFEIEAELFKLFGGVNKKYKEKGRSLLFNLKDKSNPKLREKVMYGEIAAERLCSMSAEELASKELAEWRQAKAEEMAQMVFLQDTEVDIRSLVRKTHKGEFQVEVEPMDSGSVEVSVGMSSLNWSRPKNIKKKTPSITKAHGIKNELNGSNEGTGPINGVTIDDEMQTATGSLPTIVSLDEFMSSIDSESPSVSDNNDVEAHLVCISPKENANIDLGTSPVKAEAFSPLKAEDGDTVSLKPDSDLKSEIISGFIPDGERVWEGALQLSASTVSSVIGILRSGEKTTTKEWPMLLEIKGRVRLDAFEKFVRELPNSRSRAVMNWHDEIPVEDQGRHETCWKVTSIANISDARFIHKIDPEYTRYSGQFLMEFANKAKSQRRFKDSEGAHYCYGYSSYSAMVFAMNNGIPVEADWEGIGCPIDHMSVEQYSNELFVSRELDEVKVCKHVLNDVRLFSDINLAVKYLKIQPLIGSIAVFTPDFGQIEDKIYRGPTRDDSMFKRWHSVSIRSITFVNGEAIAECKNSHGLERGNQGYFKASLDVMISDVYSNGSFKSPSRLFRSFVYGEVRKEYEGIEEVIGTPIDRALFKWAIELQAKMNITYNKSDSITLKGPCDKCLPRKKGVKSAPKVEAKGTAVEGKIPSLNGVRIHWKGKPEFILEKCLLDGAGKERILEAIKKMAAKNLICIAICTNSEMNQLVPDEDNRKQWKLTCDRLDLLAVFGIQSPRILPKDALEKQAPLDFDEGDDDPSLDYLVDLVDSTICPSISSFEGNMEGTPQVEDELFDLDWSSYPPTLVKSTWQYDYEIALFARIGLHCHNFQKGTNYKFKRLEKCGTHSTRYEDYYITFEATDPTSSSVFSFQTMLGNDYKNLTWGIGLTLASLAARIKATHGTESVDEVWDMAAIDDSYKGPMPKWFSDEALVRDDKKFYVVQESELHENDWLQLLMEVAFYSKTESGVSACKPLEIKKVVVETLEEYTTEAREKLKADNAIFYISYKCIADPSTPWAGEHDAIIRKTMDGKPGHMSLEVAVTKEQIEDRET
ncbi:unnamed protein product [Arabidopsis arenosa]|uniref:TFIIS central domain-containing protein n=1 Tax=Arabidopsis arenosa TaxID=38785 RepID=A0A8S2AAS6_ARAAE|nr:unnamed protein product [Arabidopsis arenosa]